jgi:methionine sulfoxide reductase heme-binding subunit
VRDPLHYGWWLTSRAAGLVAVVLVSASVLIGLAMAARVLTPGARIRLRDAHEKIAVAGLVALVLHGALLLPDPWLRPGLAGIVVPFASPYRPLWTGLGVLAGYLAVGLGASFYVRRRLGAGRWRRLHRLTPLVYPLVVAHVIGGGTDGTSAWLEVVVLAPAAAILVLLARRWFPRPRARARAVSAP